MDMRERVWKAIKVNLQATFASHDYRGTIDTSELADAILSTIDQAGFVIVPREPTSEMMRAAEEYFWPDVCDGVTLYRSMISAASPSRGG